MNLKRVPPREVGTGDTTITVEDWRVHSVGIENSLWFARANDFFTDSTSLTWQVEVTGAPSFEVCMQSIAAAIRKAKEEIKRAKAGAK